MLGYGGLDWIWQISMLRSKCFKEHQWLLHLVQSRYYQSLKMFEETEKLVLSK